MIIIIVGVIRQVFGKLRSFTPDQTLLILFSFKSLNLGQIVNWKFVFRNIPQICLCPPFPNFYRLRTETGPNFETRVSVITSVYEQIPKRSRMAISSSERSSRQIRDTVRIQFLLSLISTKKYTSIPLVLLSISKCSNCIVLFCEHIFTTTHFSWPKTPPPMPSHVLTNFRGFPPGCGDSVADF